MSEDAAEILASAVINEASWHLQHHAQADRASAIDLSDQQLQTSKDISTTLYQISLTPQYPDPNPSLAATSTLVKSKGLSDQQYDSSWHIPDWSQPREIYGNPSYNVPSTSYQQLNQGTELPFQSGGDNGWTLPQIEPSSPWIDSFDAAGDYGRTSRQGSSASAGEWHPLCFLDQATRHRNLTPARPYISLEQMPTTRTILITPY